MSACLQQAGAGDAQMLLDKYVNTGILPDFPLFNSFTPFIIIIIQHSLPS